MPDGHRAGARMLNGRGAAGLLSGVRIFDLTRLLPGPFCSMLLADMGADVLKVEEPGRGDYFRWMEPLEDGASVYFRSVNRNKRSMTLNLKSDEGREILLALARRHDVVLESFRPGVADRLGIGYEAVKAVNPGIVYCSISAYGQDGPCRDRAGHDGNVLALSGLLDMAGEPEGNPVFPPVPLADIPVGGFLAGFSIAAALVRKGRTGEGAFLDVSMFDGALSMAAMQAALVLNGGRIPGRGRNHFAGGSVGNTVYRTGDGRHLAISIIERKFWRNFCGLIGRADLQEGDFLAPKADSLVGAEVQKTLLTRTMREWAALLEGSDVCVEPVLTLAEALEGDLVRARRMVVQVAEPGGGTAKQLGCPVKTPGGAREEHRRSPALGEHTRDVLRGLGLPETEIDGLFARAVV